jgi:hypothetical protein
MLTIEYPITIEFGDQLLDIIAIIEGIYGPGCDGGQFEAPYDDEMEVIGIEYEWPDSVPMKIRTKLSLCLRWIIEQDMKNVERMIKQSWLNEQEAIAIEKYENGRPK